MRALQLTDYHGPAGLQLVDVPEPGATGDAAVVDVAAIGINYPDLLLTKGLYQLKPELPFVPGCEISGVLREVPDGSGWTAGDRVAAFIWQGGYAERAQVPVSHLMRLPDDMDHVTGAAMMVNYHTVHFALTRRGRLQAGERLLVLGAGGGIGSAAVQVGKGLGATVVAGVADPDQVPVAQAAGADEVIVLEEGFSSRVKELTGGRGVDAVLDPLGDWLFLEGVRSLAPEGRILVIGFAAGDIPTIKVNRLLLANTSVIGVAWGAFLGIDPDLLQRSAAELSRMAAAGVVRPQIGARYTFEQIPEALTELEAGRIRGKAVALVADGG
jgi:NADPH:quinone reductase